MSVLEEPEEFLYCRAIVDGEGGVRWEYCLAGNNPGRMAHDEDVSGWTDEEIVALTVAMLAADPGRVEVIHE